MTVYGAVMGGRRAAELLMTDACTITRPVATADTVDPATGLPVSGGAVLIYSGKCRFKTHRISNPTGQLVGGDSIIVQVFTLSVPSTSARMQVQDLVILTAALYHPGDLVPPGFRYRVTSLSPDSQLTAQRCQVQVITG